ncbi:hypothetical protein KIH23_11650 [Flavobacterium sp. CYK-55]|nr:hypothetical protein [Flavobacterium sp. CYK-55]
MILSSISVLAQAPKKIIIEHSDFADVNQVEMPDAFLLTGNVRILHDGVRMFCNKAYYFQNENYVKAFGDVRMIQGDTLFMNSKYAEYNGNVKQAFATGKVVLRSPDMTLETDTLNYDRVSQQAYYNTRGVIVNKDNVLKSKSGRYYATEKKFQFKTAVTITNPKYVVKSNRLDYYNHNGQAYLMGPSTITSKDNFIYTEKGFYDSKKNIGHFIRNSYIKYKDRRIEGDSLYYDRTREFASATNNVKITDTINKGIVKGHYAEVFKKKDSLFVTKRAIAINLVDKDSVYIHGKILMVTGKPNQRIIRAYNNARFYKTDMSGKCDSIHSSQISNITQLIGKPILWNFKNQLTGDVMHLIGNDKTQKLDSLKVLSNAFIISKDTIGDGYNQVKGLNLFGKFKENQLYEADVVKNTEVVYYMRNDQNELIGINKNVSSRINMTMDGNTIDTMTFFTNVDGDIYPEKDLPENARKLRGFVWRDDERIKSKNDLFSEEDNALDVKIQEEKKKREEQFRKVDELENLADVLDQKVGGIVIKNNDIPENDSFTKKLYDLIFKNYNNRIISDINGQKLLIRNNKFLAPLTSYSLRNLKEKYSEYNTEINIKAKVWFGEKTQLGIYYDTEFDEKPKGVLSSNEYDEIFKKYNNRIIIDKNNQTLLVKGGKFQFAWTEKSLENYKKNNPKYKNEIHLDKVVWDWPLMEKSQFNGMYFYDGKLEEIEMMQPEKITYSYIFSNYNNRILFDQNERPILVKDDKFYFFEDNKIYEDFKAKYQQNTPEIRLYKKIWDWKTMKLGSYYGGYYKP